jgi:DNA-binding XRE family transcriptional regulator
MIRITKVKALPEFRLQLSFSDGTSGVADLRHEVETFPPFAPLRDPAVFGRARPQDGTVAWPGDLDIAAERLYALAHGLPGPDTFEQARANELAVSLRELRRLSGARQEDLASTLEVTQGAISKLESGAAESKLGTLRRYLSALGWDLEVVAVQGDKRIKLRGV